MNTDGNVGVLMDFTSVCGGADPNTLCMVGPDLKLAKANRLPPKFTKLSPQARICNLLSEVKSINTSHCLLQFRWKCFLFYFYNDRLVLACDSVAEAYYTMFILFYQNCQFT